MSLLNQRAYLVESRLSAAKVLKASILRYPDLKVLLGALNLSEDLAYLVTLNWLLDALDVVALKDFGLGFVNVTCYTKLQL
jgi:hypothetical protein